LIGAVVVDSEGYIFGNVSKIDISPQGPIFKIKASEKISDVFPDTEKLQKILIEEINQNGEQDDVQITSVEGLHNFIANELDVRSVTEKEIIEFAQQKNIEVPQKEMVKEFEVEREDVNLVEVEAMNKNELGSCILLKISSELDRRKLPKLRMVGYKSEEELLGKLVIDNLGRILGTVYSFMMSVGGMRIKIAKESKETKLIPDTKSLRKMLKDKKQQKILREMTGSSDVDDLDDHKVISLAKSLDYEIPTNYTSNKTYMVYKTSVPWSHIKKLEMWYF
jgi:ribosomal 30S subunit maturation factor RimM